jgi:hypothetical protein
MKTSDSYSRGFPALWNVVAFYLFLLKPAPWVAAIAIAALAAATFAPLHFIHPIRVPRWRLFGAVGGALGVGAGAKPRSARLGWRGFVGNRHLFRDRGPAARRRVIPCTASAATYDRPSA